jgi:dihydrolipoamide dehydrogenase
MGGTKGAIDYTAVPRCIYTHPEASAVGLTEEDARKKYGEVKIGCFPLQASGKARIFLAGGICENDHREKIRKDCGNSFSGAPCHRNNFRGALAINLECTSEELAYTIHPHPTLSEIMMEAALNSEGYKIHNL